MNLANFAPALIGGMAIGTAAAMLLYFNGRIAGISSITAKLFFVSKNDWLWRMLFLIGLVGGARIAYLYYGHVPVPRDHFPAWLLAVGGLLVGLGTSLGNGCTSGHGVCGLGRLSVRSLVATLTFLVTGIVTAIVVRHVFGVM